MQMWQGEPSLGADVGESQRRCVAGTGAFFVGPGSSWPAGGASMMPQGRARRRYYLLVSGAVMLACHGVG